MDAHGYDYILLFNPLFKLVRIEVEVYFISAWGLRLLVLISMGNSYGLKVWNE
jgi:hypothetical protein